MKVLKVEDLTAAKLDPLVITLFNEYWPEGMEITPENIAQASATGLEIKPLIEKLLPPEAWDEYLKFEGAIVATHQAALSEIQQRRAASIAMSQSGIFPKLREIAARLSADVEALAKTPAIRASWSRTPDLIRAPFGAAAGAVEDAIKAQAEAALGFDQEAGVAITAADKALADGVTAALVAIIDAIPADEAEAQPE